MIKDYKTIIFDCDGVILNSNNIKKDAYYKVALSHYGEESANFLVEYLAKNNNGYQIVFRPHPSENINSLKIFLKDIPNLYIIREDSISALVNHAFAVMHNGCTTGLESIISGKPLLTFIPFEMEHDNKFLNSIGFKLNSKEVLLKKANEINFELEKNDIETIIDDTDENLSSKIKKMSLIGAPYQIIIGKQTDGDLLEFKEIGKETQKINLSEIINIIKKEKTKN